MRFIEDSVVKNKVRFLWRIMSGQQMRQIPLFLILPFAPSSYPDPEENQGSSLRLSAFFMTDRRGHPLAGGRPLLAPVGAVSPCWQKRDARSKLKREFYMKAP
jgi:hypothetical protein